MRSLTGLGREDKVKSVENRLVVIKNNPYSFYFVYHLLYLIGALVQSQDISSTLETDNDWFTCPVLHRRYVNHLPGINRYNW